MNMNNIVKFAAAVLFVSVAFTSSAQDEKTVLLTPVKNERAVNVYVDLKEDIPYSVSIIDAKGYTVWSTTSKKSVFARSIVLDEVPDGTYTVKVTSDNRFVENTFSISEDAIIKQNVNAAIAPTVSVMGQTVLVDFDANGITKDVDVKIYSRGGTEVFANNITSDAKRITRYDLSSLTPGYYDMVFTIAGEQFTRNVRIR